MIAAGAVLLQIENPDLSKAIDSSGVTLVDWAVALAVLLGGVALAMAARRAVMGTVRRSSSGGEFAELLLGRVIAAAVILIALVYALGVIGIQIAPLLGALGLGGIALALALQPTLQNLFAGIILHAQRPFRLGDEVRTGDVQGRVTDITSRAVVVERNSGETVFLPNALVLDREIENLVRTGRRRTTLVVGVAYGTDLVRARQVIYDATVAAEGVLDTVSPRVLASAFSSSSVDFDVDFWSGAAESERRGAIDSVILAVHQALGDAGITIPFPQRTVWFGDGDRRPPGPAPGDVDGG